MEWEEQTIPRLLGLGYIGYVISVSMALILGGWELRLLDIISRLILLQL